MASSRFAQWVNESEAHENRGAHKRYCQTASLFGDKVAAEVMGLNKIVSHDSLSRGLAKMDETLAESWMQEHLIKTYEPLLAESYILDVDPTVKQIYGHQEGSAIGYNPTKPGRPSLCYHTYFVANLRLVFDVDVRAAIAAPRMGALSI